jgi:hypothetical protein
MRSIIFSRKLVAATLCNNNKPVRGAEYQSLAVRLLQGKDAEIQRGRHALPSRWGTMQSLFSVLHYTIKLAAQPALG